MKNRQASSRVRPQFEELEPRILYSADAGALLHPDAITPSAEVRILDLTSSSINNNPSTQASAAKSEIVFVDTRVKNYQQLIDDINSQNTDGRHIEVQILDSHLDGVQQITDALAGRKDISAIHLIAEGNTAELLLGSSLLNQDSLNNLYAKNLTDIGNSLTQDADILVYGCNFGRGAEVELVMQTLANLTGADIAASNDRTGHSTEFANWSLEVNIGNIETNVAVSAWGQQNWFGDLSIFIVSNTNDSGIGSFRQAVINANGNAGTDTVAFVISGTGIHTINLLSSIYVSEAVIIDGTTDDSFFANGNRPIIVLNGGNFVQDGIQLYTGSSGSTIRGIVFQNFTQDAIDIASSDNNTIVGNWIGLNTAGTAAAGNQQGVNIWDGSNNTIGGTTAADRNVISGNSGSAIFIGHDGFAPSNNNQIIGNYIGTNTTGSSAISNYSGIYIQNSANTVIGTSATGAGNVISGSTFANVNLYGAGTTGSKIQNNYIGTNAAGNADIDGSTALDGSSGVVIDVGANNNLIGTNADGTNDTLERNIISGNNWFGVEMVGAGTSNNLVQGNYIGTDVTGLVALGNAEGGASFWDNASNNNIGSGLAGAGNVISGNSRGVLVADAATNNKVQGNLIGLGADGSTIIGNSFAGIYFNKGNSTSATTGNIIGTDANGNNDAGERNVISGNASGILMENIEVTGNTIAGNYIGTDITGTLDRGNTFAGININSGASNNIIGGITSTQRNIISGNDYAGITTIGSGTNNNIIIGNYIGTDKTGAAAISNSSFGVVSWDGAVTQVGGTFTGEGNLIANSAIGVHVDLLGALDATTTILGNQIYNNSLIGISLSNTGGNDGVTLNDLGDSDTGGNSLQNFPVLTSAVSNVSDTIFAGSLNSEANKTYRIEFFSNSSGSADPSNYGAGKTYLGYQDVSTDSAGNATFSATLTGVLLASGDAVSATATLKIGVATFAGTSEFAMNILASFANTPPAGIDGNVNVTEDTDYVFTLADFGFTDVDSNSLFRVIISSLPTQGTLKYLGATFPAGNYISLGSLQNGEFTYSPPTNANGSALTSFTFQIQDDGGTANGGVDTDQTPNTLTINVSSVNDAPTTSAVALAPIAEDSGARLITQAELLANAADVDGPSLTATGLTITSANGSLVDNGNGTWTYTPALNDDTSVSFSYTVTDGTLTAAGSATLDITSVNDAPVNTIPAGQYTLLNTAKVFSNANSNAILISDVDAASGNMQVTLTATHGTLTLAGITGLTISAGANGSNTLTFTGSIANINNALDGLSYTPTNGYRGLAQLSITTDDQGNTGTGGTLTDADTLNIHVGALVVTNATDSSNGNTSSIAALIASDGGDGISLREAISAVNNTAGADYIYFNIAGGGPHTINLTAALPDITTAVVIDGTSEPDFGGTPMVVLNGSGAGGVRGLSITGSNVTVRGLVIQQFGSSAIQISSGASNVSIVGNYIGTDVTGLVARGNGGWGIDVIGAGATGVVIGGTTTADRNIITSNSAGAIALNNTQNVIVIGNYIGVGADSVASLGNTGGILLLNNTTGSRVGGSTNNEQNIIANSTGGGFANGAGVAVQSAISSSSILGNSFYNNAGQAIDIGINNTVLINDALDVDTGPNNLQNYAVLSIASSKNGNTYVVGSLNSTATTNFRIEFFSSPTGDASGNGEGRVYLGFANVTTDSSGNASFSTTLTGISTIVGHVLSATTTVDNGAGSFGSTSEFSQNIVIAGNIAPTTSTVTLTAIAEDSGARMINQAELLANASDVDGPSITATNLTIASGSGGLVDNFDGTWTYTPALNDDTTVSFSYTVTDGSLSATGSANLDVTPVNDAPVINIVAPRTTNEEVIKVFSQFIGNAITISDVDAGNNLLQLTVSASNGTVSLGHTSGLSFSVGDGVADVTMTFTGTLADINNALDGIGYMPTANYNGPAPLDFNLNDLGNTGTGGTLSSTASQIITVLPVNDAPLLTPYGPSYSTSEGAAPITTTVATVLSSSVTDIDSGAVQGIALYAASGTGGLLEYSIDGGSSWLSVGSVSSTSALLLRANDLLRFTPDTINGGTMLIDYRAWDQSVGITGTKVDASVTGGISEFSVANERVTVNTSSVNDAPTATIAPTNYSATEQILLTLHGSGLSIADVDAGSAMIRATITVISGTLNADAGTTGISISGSSSTNITLVGTTTQINDLLSGNLGSTLTYIINSDTPPATDTLTLTVEDLGNTGSGGALTGTDSATININPVNDAPVVTTSVTTINYTENDPLLVIDSAISITDADNTSITGATIQIHPLSYRNGQDVLSFTDQLGITGIWDSGTGVLTLTGTTSLANYQTALRQVSYFNTSEQPDNNVRTVVFTVSDGTSSSSASTRDINVFPVNDAPTTTMVTLAPIAEDSGARIITSAELLANAADADTPLANLTASGLTITSGLGNLVDNGNGTWTYTPLLNDDTAVSFSYTINDGSGGTVAAAADLDITPVNDAAVITPAVTNLTETNSPLSTSGTLVITDIDSAITFATQTNAAGNNGYGVFNLASNGAWTYTANTAHDEFVNGTTYTDSLTVTSADGTTSTITVNILGVNDAAIITPAVANLTETNVPLSTGGTLTINDTDSPATFVVQTAVAGSNAYGVFNLASNGAWTYTANTAHDEFVTGNTYTDTLTVTSADGTTSTITVNILGTNDAAVIAPAVANLIETNAPLTTGGTLVISDVDSAVAFATQSNAAGSNGYGVFNLASNGAWTYTANTAHDEFVNGTTYTDSLTVTSVDGTTSTITINILGTNDAPTASNISLNVLEDNVLNGFLPIATDADSVTVTYSLGSAAAHGSVTVAADGTFSFNPDLHYNGADSFTYIINDGNGGTNTYTVSINVISVNNNPTASNASINAIEDTLYSGTLPIATDVENDPIIYSLNTGALHGTVNVDLIGGFTYTASANYNGTDSFTYTVTDSLGGANTYTISIAVAAVNDAPLASDDSVTGLEDNNIAGNVLTNDSDIENSALTAILVSGPVNGTLNLNANGSFTYTPNANWNGTDTFTYKTNDGNADSNIARVTINVTPQNDTPTTSPVTLAAIAEDNGAHLITQAQLLANALDVDGDTLAVTNLAIATGNGVLVDNLNGTWTYTPASNDDTAVSFSYNVTDGSLIAVGLADLDLTPVNDAPTDANLNISTLENTTFTGTLPIATDIEGDAITYSLSAGASHGSVTVNTNGNFTYTPVAYYSGADSFTYKIDDGNGGSNTYTVTINSLNVNDAPTASNATINAIEDTLLIGTLPTATDLDNNPITYTLNAGALHGTVNVYANGNFTYAPTGNYNGVDSFTYTVSDGLGGANTYTISINVAAVNDLPLANNDSVTGLEDNNVTGNVLINDSDVDSPTLTAILVTGPTNGTLNLNANGSFTYTPDANWNGTETFTYQANDGSNNSITATVTIAITPINDAPTTSAVTLNAVLQNSGAHLITQAQLLANAADVDGNALTVTNLAISAGNGVLINNLNGTWTYTLASSDGAAVSFSYTVTDGSLIATGTANMDIIPVIVPPPPTPPVTPTPVDPVTLPATPKPVITDPPPTEPTLSNKPATNSVTPTIGLTADANQNLIVNLDSNAIKNANTLVSRLNQQDTAFSIIDLINLPSTSVSNNVTEIFNSLTHNAQIQIDAIEFAEAKSSPAQEIGKIFFDNKIALTSVAVSAGLVAWAAQYGILFSSVLATLPAWRNLDPVAILGKDDDDEDTEWDMSDDENDQAAEENAIEILSEKTT